MSNARHHHYLSQCYLKGFTQDNTKESMLTVIDLKEERSFKTTPRNVGGIRDFNRIEVDGVDPNIMEKMQSEFEGRIAPALEKLGSCKVFSDEVKYPILDLIAMLAVRSPEMRRHLAKPLLQIAKQALKSEENCQINPNQFNITIKQEVQIGMEIIAMKEIFELLCERNWRLLKVEKSVGEFVTSDNPVILTWHDDKKTLNNISPGYGLKDTMVYFPVTKELALVGEFDRKDGITEANKLLIAILNSKVISHSYQRVFASKCEFDYIAKGHIIKKGYTLIRK